MNIFWAVFTGLVIGWFAASYFALKGYNVLSYFIKGEQYAANKVTEIKKVL